MQRLHGDAHGAHRSFAVLAVGLATAALSLGLAEAAVHAQTQRHPQDRADLVADLTSLIPPPAAQPMQMRTVWVGADLDGDGQPDVANPTGHEPRGTDAYGEGRFHASRDGGEREHEGVDYVSVPGQAVEAPISGYVSKIGYAYPDNETLRFVEIENPALHLTARVFYVDPNVAVGDAVSIGKPIGTADNLQRRYPGITNHVHLEVAERGRKVDAQTLIFAKREPVPTDTAFGD